jgi:hypothetical protein
MVWFSHHVVAYMIFLPAGVAGALWPWLGVRARATAERPHQQGHFMACQVRGCTAPGGAAQAGGSLPCRAAPVLEGLFANGL